MANLQRQMRKPRHVIGNVGKFGRLQPFYHAYVFAGETQKEIKAQLSFMSEPINYAQTGATIDVWFYYVPFSQIWDNWQTWIMGDVTTTLSYTNANSIGNVWGNTMTSSGNLPVTDAGRHAQVTAYLNVANHYFLDDENQLTSLSEPITLPIVDASAEVASDLDYDDEDETIDVSSGTLSLKEVERKRANLRYERRVEMMDGKYINWLKNQGVNASEQLTDTPEFLGHYRRYIKPSRTVDQSNGFTVQHYGHECKIKLSKRRYFQEAGIVIGCYAVRPKVHLSGGYDMSDYIFNSPENFPQVGQLAEHKTIEPNRENSSGPADSTYQSIDAYLFNGMHQVPQWDNDYIKVYAPATKAEAKYPSSAWDNMLVTSQGVHYSVDGVVGHSLVTPLRKLLPA